MAYGQKYRNRAFQIWLDTQCNLDAALRQLREEFPAHKISRPTLKKWRDEGDWEDRAARIDLQEKLLTKETDELELAMLGELGKLAKAYAAKFGEKDAKPDPQDVYAYLKIAQTVSLMKGRRRVAGLDEAETDKKKDPEEMRRAADEILQQEYGIKRESGEAQG